MPRHGSPEGGQGRTRVVYLAGSGRSGSTLLERTLGRQHRCVNVGELIELFRKVSVADERCGCGQPFLDCPFWTEVGRLYGGWGGARMAGVAELQRRVGRQRRVPQLLATKVSGAGFSDDVKRLGQEYAHLYSSVTSVADADVVVDASKWPAHALALGRSGELDLRVVHLVRDARGVAHSWSKTGVVRPHAAPSGDATSASQATYMATHKVGRTALRWSAFQSECELLTRTQSLSARVRYEDFVRRPGPVVQSVLRSLQLTAVVGEVSGIVDDRIDLPASHGLAGNPSRFKIGETVVRADERWRTDMSSSDSRTVTAVAWPLLLAYGYLSSSSMVPS